MDNNTLPELSYREGETLDLSFQADEDATSVDFIVSQTSSSPTPSIYETANFVDGEAFINEPVDIAEGDYVYQITYVYSNGDVEKYPKANNCDGDECDLPSFKVCPALDPGVS